MTKLNDTQRAILAAAGARQSLLVFPLPKTLGLAAAKAHPILQKMIGTGLLAERPVTTGEQMWRRDETHGALTLAVTTAGLSAIGIETEPAAPVTSHQDAAPRRRTSDKGQSRVPASEVKPAGEVGPDTKLGKVVLLLKSKKGATIDQLTTLTGWQAHSVRGAISGALKKKMGLTVESAVVEGRGRVYRIAL